MEGDNGNIYGYKNGKQEYNKDIHVEYYNKNEDEGKVNKEVHVEGYDEWKVNKEMSMKELVKEVLRLDNLYLDNIRESRVYGINDIKNKVWDYSYPTIIRENKMYESKIMESDEGFSRLFYYAFPFFKKNGMDFDFSNVLIAGGCVSNILFKSIRYIKDVDIFIYGLNKDEAEVKVKKILTDLNADNIIIRDNVVEFSIRNGYKIIRKKIQIILKVYNSINEILYTFDVGSSAVGFDGKRLYFTEVSKFAYETKCNIISLKHVSLSYEYRLLKYYRRGFDIIMPEFDISKVKDGKVKLEFMPEIHIVENNKLSISKDAYKVFYMSNRNISDYIGIDSFSIYRGPKDMMICLHNICKVIVDKNPYIYITNDNIDKLSELDNSDDMNNIKRLLNVTKLDEMEKTISEIFYKFVDVNHFMKNSGLVLKIFTIDEFTRIVKKMDLYQNNNDIFKIEMDRIKKDKIECIKDKINKGITNLIRRKIFNWFERKEGDTIIKPFNPRENGENWYGNFKKDI